MEAPEAAAGCRLPPFCAPLGCFESSLPAAAIEAIRSSSSVHSDQGARPDAIERDGAALEAAPRSGQPSDGGGPPRDGEGETTAPRDTPHGTHAGGQPLALQSLDLLARLQQAAKPLPPPPPPPPALKAWSHPPPAPCAERGDSGEVVLASVVAASPLRWLASLDFREGALERGFAQHYAAAQEKVDALVAVLLLALPLAVLVAPGACGPAAWPAAAAAALLLTPFLLDLTFYRGQRELLVGAAQLQLGTYLAPAGPTGVARTGGLPQGPAVCAGPPAGAQLAGFGLLRFLLHSCGLFHLVVAPLLLRLRLSRAVPVQGVNLALALLRLPHAYAAALGGGTDPVHLVLLGLVLALGACAGLCLARAAELQARAAWLRQRLRPDGGCAAQ